jgi:hypothetical protein
MTARPSLVRVFGGVFLVLILAAAVFNNVIGWFVGIGLGGGALMAAVMLRASRHGRQRLATPDAFARDPLSTDVINVNRIRVAGIGGLGLVIVAAAVALQYDLAALVVGLGLIGGATGALLLILYRRRGGPIGSSSGGLGARIMLTSRPAHRADSSDSRGPEETPRTGLIPAPAVRQRA